MGLPKPAFRIIGRQIGEAQGKGVTVRKFNLERLVSVP
jgi:hypothetical protein